MFLDGATKMGYMDVDDEIEEEEEEHSSLEEELFIPLPPDEPLSKMNILLDCELRGNLQEIYQCLWGNEIGQMFLQTTMQHTHDIDIHIDTWKPLESSDQYTQGIVFSKELDYQSYRTVESLHPPKTKFPGLPPYACCKRLQRLRIDKTSDGVWTRFIISDMARMSQIPFSDAFEIETRWVFTLDGNHYCHVQTGLTVHFLKSTWFKSQINSSTQSESKEVLEIWAKQAAIQLEKHRVPIQRDDKTRRESTPPVEQRVSLQSTSSVSTTTVPALNTTTVRYGSWIQWLLLFLIGYCLVLLRMKQNEIVQLMKALENERSIRTEATSVCRERGI